jgi:transcriptional regulator with XRE-family HTH domain
MKTIDEFKSQHSALFNQEELILEVTELLASVMNANNISKAELAKRLNKSKAFVTQCLSGSQNLTLRTLADLFTALEYQLQLGAIPNSARSSKSVHRLYPVGGWAFEKQCINQDLVIDCAGSEDLVSEGELCAA